MHDFRLRKNFALCLLVTLVAATTTYGQQKYRLRDISAVGDVAEYNMTSDMNVAFHAALGNEQSPEFVFSQQEQRKYREAITAVDAKGRPSAVRRNYTVARTITSTADNPSKSAVSSLQGKTVTMRRNGSQLAVTATKGRLLANDVKRLKEELAGYGEPFFPDRDLAIGEEWTVEPKALTQSLGGAEKATIKAKLLEVVPYMGHQCARVKIDVEAVSKVPTTPMTITMSLTGDLYHALDLQRTLSVSFGGPVAAKGQDTREGVTLDLIGEGTAQIDITARWLKIGGKPVSPANK